MIEVTDSKGKVRLAFDENAYEYSHILWRQDSFAALEDALGGCDGRGWREIFEDAKDGEVVVGDLVGNFRANGLYLFVANLSVALEFLDREAIAPTRCDALPENWQVVRDRLESFRDVAMELLTEALFARFPLLRGSEDRIEIWRGWRVVLVPRAEELENEAAEAFAGGVLD